MSSFNNDTSRTLKLNLNKNINLSLKMKLIYLVLHRTRMAPFILLIHTEQVTMTQMGLYTNRGKF